MSLIANEAAYWLSIFKTQLKVLRQVVNEIESLINIYRLDKKLLAKTMGMSNTKFNRRLNSRSFSIAEIVELAELINNMIEE